MKLVCCLEFAGDLELDPTPELFIAIRIMNISLLWNHCFWNLNTLLDLAVNLLNTFYVTSAPTRIIYSVAQQYAFPGFYLYDEMTQFIGRWINLSFIFNRLYSFGDVLLSKTIKIEGFSASALMKSQPKIGKHRRINVNLQLKMNAKDLPWHILWISYHQVKSNFRWQRLTKPYNEA